MEVKEEAYDVGVMVGRFQVPALHEGHRGLFEYVRERHNKVIVFLGLAPVPSSRTNPLDFEARKQMLHDAYPDLIVNYVKDIDSDEGWSKILDNRIGDLITPSQSVVLYGGRDSFIDRYHGKFPTRELLQDTWYSGDSIRKEIARSATIGSPEFRRGVIWSAYSRFPASIPTVDIAIYNDDFSKVLLAKKPREGRFRFIGGFADPGSSTYEADARREVMEEAHVEISDPWYITSRLIDDWRYRVEVDKIKTLFFGAKYLSGQPQPDDDIEEVKWFEIDTLKLEQIMPVHRELFELMVGDAMYRQAVTTLSEPRKTIKG